MRDQLSLCWSRSSFGGLLVTWQTGHLSNQLSSALDAFFSSLIAQFPLHRREIQLENNPVTQEISWCPSKFSSESKMYQHVTMLGFRDSCTTHFTTTNRLINCQDSLIVKTVKTHQPKYVLSQQLKWQRDNALNYYMLHRNQGVHVFLFVPLIL